MSSATRDVNGLPPEDSVAGIMHKLYAHAAWLYSYAKTAQSGDWRDNALYAARQADWLKDDLDKLAQIVLREAVDEKQ